MKALVTGGAGFIGSNLAGQLLRDGHTVTILDNLSSGYRTNLASIPGARFVEGDIREERSVRGAMEHVEVVFHLAASVGNQRSIDNPILDAEVNIIGTLRVLEAARRAGVRKLVASSSAGIFGELKTLPIREDHPIEPDSPYGASKLRAEKETLAFGKLFAIEIVCLRYFNVYGPNQRFDAYGNVIPIFGFQMLRGERLTIFGDGEQTRDFVTERVRRVVLALAVLAALQAVGVMTRYGQDPFSTVRISWNLTGLLAAVAAVAAVGCLPGMAPTVLLWASVGIVALSGSRGAAMFTMMGTFLILVLSRGVLRRMILIWSLCAAVGIGWALLGRVRPEIVSDPVVAMRALRSVTFEDADRAESWGYWLDKCTESPFGTGMAATGYDDFDKVGSHNSWLDLWARGGILCAVIFTIGQIVFLSTLVRVSSLEEWRALAIALAVAASVRMCVEVLPLSTSYGMNGLLILFVGGIALSHRRPAPATLRIDESARTINLSSRTIGALVGVGR